MNENRNEEVKYLGFRLNQTFYLFYYNLQI